MDVNNACFKGLRKIKKEMHSTHLLDLKDEQMLILTTTYLKVPKAGVRDFCLPLLAVSKRRLYFS